MTTRTMDLREQACWLLLVFESELPARVVHDILVAWCQQSGRTLQEFFDAEPKVWSEVCQLNATILKKLEQAKEKRVGQTFLAEQLSHNAISMLTVLDDVYPRSLKATLKPHHLPPILFYAGDLDILNLITVAIIGSRNASETSLTFTRDVAYYFAEQGANVISGNARGVDRAAYEGATSTEGCTTVVLPHGIRKLSGVQMRALQPKIDAGNVLLLSQFYPDAPWVVSRAMERNKIVTGLAQIVIVAEADIKGGTWEGANGALQQKRPVYVRQTESSSMLPGNEALLKLGGQPLPWPTKTLDDTLSPLFRKSAVLHEKLDDTSAFPGQLALFGLSNEQQPRL